MLSESGAIQFSYSSVLIDWGSYSSFQVINLPSNHVESVISALTRGAAAILCDIVVCATAETWRGLINQGAN